MCNLVANLGKYFELSLIIIEVNHLYKNLGVILNYYSNGRVGNLNAKLGDTLCFYHKG